MTSKYKPSGRTISIQMGIIWSATISLCCTILAILLLVYVPLTAHPTNEEYIINANNAPAPTKMELIEVSKKYD